MSELFIKRVFSINFKKKKNIKMAKKKTVFQALDQAITGNWKSNDIVTPHVNSYDLSKGNGSDIVFKTTDKDEYLQKKLELQQNKYLKDRWVKANVNLSVTAYAGLNNIKLMYRDADMMDAFPEIGAALEILSEESTITSSDGTVVNVYSKSERIKSILEDLFVNRLNIQLTAQMVIRAMCKYGNQFMLLDIDNKNGVKGWKQLPVFNVERIENGIQNPYGGASIAVNGVNKNEADLSTQFIWLDDNNSQTPFRDWQVAHFRLLSNSLYLPYGCSFLNSARRHWRMLSLMEDMMLIYRLERSIERRVYKIYVGAIDDADVQAYVEEVANQFKRTPIIDPMTGQVDLRKNILPVHKDTPIPLLDGRTVKIKDLAAEFENGKINYVYSIQDNTHKIVPGKVVWCGKNYTAKKLIKITLDDDSHMILAPEHEIIMRDGTKKRADEVIVGESVMPLYRGSEQIAKHYKKRYETVYNPNSGKFEFTHRLVASELERGENDSVIHHVNFNNMDNTPTNLKWMPWDEHRNYHASLNATDRVRKIRSESVSEKWRDEDYRAKSMRNMKVEFDDYVWKAIDDAVKNGLVYSQNTMLDFINQNLVDYLISTNNSNKLKNHRKVSKKLLSSRIKDAGYDNCEEYLSEKDEQYGLIPHFIRLSEEKSDRAKKYDLIKNIKIRWEDTDKSQEIKERISKSNKERFASGFKMREPAQFDDYVWTNILESVLKREINCATELYEYVNGKLIDHIIEISPKSTVLKNKRISRKTVLKRIHDKYGFDSANEFIESMRLNHKIKSIEIVGGDDVYCMTVEGLNGEDDRHNFALITWKPDGSLNDSGVIVSNCVDQDIFIPVRDENAPTPIDTLSAAQNMTALDDIKFVQNKVLTALRIPKTFLNFEENAGDGKNLALLDIRFTRTVNRVQQAFLMELTKIATIHLFLLGFNDELTNFTLSMNNPSTQAESLEIENMQKKIDAVRDAVSDPGNGLPVMSQTRALKEIMKWSEKDIKENFEEIRLEKGIAAELEKTTQIIKKTGIFDKVDRIYGEPGAEYVDDQQQQGDEMGGDMGGGAPPMGGGGADLGGELDNLGGPGMDEGGDINGTEGSMPTADMGAGGDTGMGAPEEEQQVESASRNKPLITEDVFETYINRLSEHKIPEKEVKYERAEVYDSSSLLVNEEFDKMINALGKFVNEE